MPTHPDHGLCPERSIFRILRKYSGSNATGNRVNPAKKAPKSPTASLQFQRTGAHLKSCLHGTAVIGRSKTATIGRERQLQRGCLRRPHDARPLQRCNLQQHRARDHPQPRSQNRKRDATSICIVSDKSGPVIRLKRLPRLSGISATRCAEKACTRIQIPASASASTLKTVSKQHSGTLGQKAATVFSKRAYAFRPYQHFVGQGLLATTFCRNIVPAEQNV